MRVFPDCFPSNFISMLPSDYTEDDFPVYRVALRGILCRDAFLGSVEEEEVHPRRSKKYKPKDRSCFKSFSTSCFETLEGLHEATDLMVQNHPKASILYGMLLGELGPSWKQTNRDHVHWWLYKDVDPSPYFKAVEENGWK